MITFLKGDTTAAITLAFAEEGDFSSKTVWLEYQCVRRSFSGVAASDTLTFSFSAEETAPMSLGAYPVRIWLVDDATGDVTTIHNAAVKFRVTDSAAEVHGGGAINLDVRGGLHGIDGLPERWNESDLRGKINEIIRRLGGAVAMLVLAFLPVFGATVEVQTAPKGEIYNDQQIVTNVVLDVSDMATLEDLAAATPGDYDELKSKVEAKADKLQVVVTNNYWTVESDSSTLDGLVLTQIDGSSAWSLDESVYNLDIMPSVVLTYHTGRWWYYDSMFVSTAQIFEPKEAAYLEATTGFGSWSNTVYLTRHVFSQTNEVVYSGIYEKDMGAISDALSNKVDKVETVKTLVSFDFAGMWRPDPGIYLWRRDNGIADIEDGETVTTHIELTWADGTWTKRDVKTYYPSGREVTTGTQTVQGALDLTPVMGFYRNERTAVYRITEKEVIYTREQADEQFISAASNTMTRAGVVTDYLASGAKGGIRIRYSSGNENNYTSYAYSGVAVRRNGVTDDYLFGTTNALGVVRFQDLENIITEICLRLVGNVYWESNDGGRTADAYYRDSAAISNIVSSATAMVANSRGNAYLNVEDGKAYVYQEDDAGGVADTPEEEQLDQPEEEGATP